MSQTFPRINSGIETSNWETIELFEHIRQLLDTARVFVCSKSINSEGLQSHCYAF